MGRLSVASGSRMGETILGETRPTHSLALHLTQSCIIHQLDFIGRVRGAHTVLVFDPDRAVIAIDPNKVERAVYHCLASRHTIEPMP